MSRELALLREGELLPTGARITPNVAKGARFEALNPDLPSRPDYTADHPVSSLTSPDGKTLLVLTSGFNRMSDASGNLAPAESNEYVFVYDITRQKPVKRQVLQVPNTFTGIAFAPDGQRFYVSGGVDDNVHVFQFSAGAWGELGAPIALGHTAGLGLAIAPEAAGLAVNRSGTQVAVANYENDSLSLVSVSSGSVAAEVELRPGKSDPAQVGVAGGEFPFTVAYVGNDKAYVSSTRDGELVVVSTQGSGRVLRRIPVGKQPSQLLLNRAQDRLFVVNSNSDSVSVVDTRTDRVLETFGTTAPPEIFDNPLGFKGSNPNSLALSPKEDRLFVTNGGTNSVAVIQLGAGCSSERGRDHGERDDLEERDDDDQRPSHESRVLGLIPTGWYPSAVSVSRDGKQLYVLNAKSNAGPNPKACNTLSTTPDAFVECNAANQYVWQNEKGGLLSLPVPGPSELERLSWQTAKNNHFPSVERHSREEAVMSELRARIKHVIYIIKENRTYDQVLGDLGRGDGDPNLTLFPRATTPNHHRLAERFVTFDNFEDSGESSGVGWNWTTAGHTSDSIEKTQPVNYAGRGLNYDWEGTNRNINVGISTLPERLAAMPFTPNDPDLLPGTADVAENEAASGEVGAYLWDTLQRKGRTVRNYGCFGDLIRTSIPSLPIFAPLSPTPFEDGIQQFWPAKAALQSNSDLYFRGFDQSYPDLYRFHEWQREFQQFESSGDLPALEFVRFNHDHFGNFDAAIDGVNTPDRQMADNDYAVGLLTETIAHSRYKADTLVFVIEDDAQDGPDHVDAHRSLAYILGPYVKRNSVISTAYNTVNLLRTIEQTLGVEAMGINDSLAVPMAEAFDLHQNPYAWTYDAIVPDILRSTTLPLPAPGQTRPESPHQAPQHDAAYWAHVTRGQDFSHEDALDTESFNRALWHGLKGDSAAYPGSRHSAR